MNAKYSVIHVDFNNETQRNDLATMLVAYSKDIMGGGKALSQDIVRKSIELLATKDYAISFIAYLNDKAIGFANCFENIATFKGKTAINIHDLAVLPEFRQQGIATHLLNAIETHAKENNMAKITLEVLDGNAPAKSLYEKFGFEGYKLDPNTGGALFWQKMLAS